jgi:hypothetical protein
VTDGDTKIVPLHSVAEPTPEERVRRLGVEVERLARQRGRFALPAMTDDYIDQCCREVARVFAPSGYLLRWSDTFDWCEGGRLHIANNLTSRRSFHRTRFKDNDDGPGTV